MMPFIYDQPACQPLYKRLFWNILTGVGWAFWIYLWLPFLGSIAMAFEVDPQSHSMAWSEHTLPSVSHVHLVSLCVALFCTWALWQGWQNRERRQPLAAQAISTGYMAQSMGLHEHDLWTWQHSQRLVIRHDEARGWIRHVEVLPVEDALPCAA